MLALMTNNLKFKYMTSCLAIIKANPNDGGKLFNKKQRTQIFHDLSFHEANPFSSDLKVSSKRNDPSTMAFRGKKETNYRLTNKIGGYQKKKIVFNQ